MGNDVFTVRWANLIGQLDDPSNLVQIPKREIYVNLVQIVDGEVRSDYRVGELFDVDFNNFTLPPHLDGETWMLRFEIQNETGVGKYSEHFDAKIERSSKDGRSVSPSSSVEVDGSSIKVVSPSGHVPGLTRQVVRHRLVPRRLRLRVPREKSRGNWFEKHVPEPPSTVDVWATNSTRSVDGATVTDTFGTFNVTSHTKSVTRTLTPNFFALKKWERPVNPYLLQETNLSTRMGYQRVESIDQSSVTALSDAGPTEYFSALPAPNLNRDPGAREKAFKNVLKDIGRDDFNLAADLVQFNQATRMISSNLSKIVKSVRAVRRGDIVTATNTLFGTNRPQYRIGFIPKAGKSVSQNWLELQYGWKPLLSDIAATIEAVHRSYHPSLRTARGAGTSWSFSSADVMGPFNGSFASVQPYVAGKRVVERQTKCLIGIQYSVSDADKLFLSQTGFTSPLSLAWEILPFSFVVDWIYPLGPYLERLTAFDGLTFRGGFESHLVRETTGLILSQSGIHGVSPQRVAITNRGGTQRQAVKFERVKLFTFPSVPSPRLKNPISVVHAANALALVRAAFRE